MTCVTCSSESAVLHIGSKQSLKRHPEVEEFFLFCIKNKLKEVNKKGRNGTKRSRPTVVKVSKGAAGPPSLLLATNQSELSWLSDVPSFWVQSCISDKLSLFERFCIWPMTHFKASDVWWSVVVWGLYLELSLNHALPLWKLSNCLHLHCIWRECASEAGFQFLCT